MINKPNQSEYPEYYGKYISLVPEGDILEFLEIQSSTTRQFLGSIETALHDFRYAPEKWTIKQIVGHLCDVERVFAYRALRFSRGDKTALPGFNENAFVANSNFNNIEFNILINFLNTLRKSSLFLFNSLSDSMWKEVGVANGTAMSVLAIPYILAGHEIHHLNIIKQRYL